MVKVRAVRKPVRSTAVRSTVRKRVRKRAPHPTNPLHVTFSKVAMLLGEVEAGLAGLYQVIEDAGLFLPAEGECAVMASEDARRVLSKAEAIATLMSEQARTIMPALFVVVGDETALRVFGLQMERPGESETVH